MKHKIVAENMIKNLEIDGANQSARIMNLASIVKYPALGAMSIITADNDKNRCDAALSILGDYIINRVIG